KRAGRGKVSIYSRRLEDKMREQAVVEQALRKAIAEKTIEPHYQPIVDLVTGKILGFEALARWTDPELGSVPPTKFIAIAEERGLIGDLTDLLFEFAAAEAAKWPKDSFLSFNLSTVQLADVGTGLKMMSAMSKAGLDPRRLEIEITETALLGDVETAKDVIRTFRSSGVGVALDDFGTGHSSLGYLRELPLDKIKIDRSFVSGIETEKQSYHIIKAVLELCAGLELKVVAEGIEERQQAARLISHGCGAGQGYLFGRPMPAASAHKLVWASARSEEQEFAVN
ncbi:MAG TPA: EAL domain-containing protein, partial [Afifellaceae bacterium]|nr:EAL domain-containing protein [Afifellaceae bacterium]